MRIPGVPIRFQVLVALLVVVSVVVGAITFTMARLFHQDKKIYVSDLASVMAMNAAYEADVLLSGYRDDLEVYAAIIAQPDLPASNKTALLEELLGRLRGLIAIRCEQSGRELFTIYNAPTLERAGLKAADLTPALTDSTLGGDATRQTGLRIVNSTVSRKLPTLTVSIERARVLGQTPMRVTAVMSLDDLQHVARRSKAFGVFLVDSRGIVLASADPNEAGRRTRVSWVPSLDPRGAATVHAFERAGVRRIGGFARAGVSGVIAGAEIPESAAYFASRLLLQRLMWVALALLVLAAVVGTFWARQITRPIVQLAEATREIGRGRFDVTVKVKTRDEIGVLASSFNHMTAELDARDRALKNAQAALIQSEKMAAFGQLGAGIAHEVKNPLAGIQGIVQLALRQADAKHPLHEALTIIEKETKRCRSIIDNLLKFARQEQVVQQPTDLTVVLEDAVAIMRHQLALHRVGIECDCAPALPLVMANDNQLQQVLMNLILNADQAFEGQPGVIRVEAARAVEGGVQLRISDNGPGIPDEIQRRIFEPFFTTKPSGQGTGLGLSVSFGIIKDHRGSIEVQSVPGQGTTFVITIPSLREDAGLAEAPAARQERPAA